MPRRRNRAISLLAAAAAVGACGPPSGDVPGTGPGGMREAGAAEPGEARDRRGEGVVAFQVELRAGPDPRTADVWIGGERIGALDRAGRKAVLDAVRARAAVVSADIRKRNQIDDRVFVKSAPESDPRDVFDVVAAVRAGGFTDIGFDPRLLRNRQDDR